MNTDVCPSPLLILNCGKIPYKSNLHQRDQLDVNKDKSWQHTGKQKSLRPGAKAHPTFIPWLICLWCSRNHKDYPDKRKLHRAIGDHKWGTTALNYIIQRYPISSCNPYPLPLSFSLSPYKCTREFVWHSSIQKMLLGERFSPSVFLMKSLMQWRLNFPVPEENTLENLILLF